MTLQSSGGVDPAFVAYLLLFGTAAVACFASVGRVRRIDDRDTRRGLTALLLTSGGWALSYVVYFLVPGETAKSAIYTVGLVVGLSTVGAWLYFCSAYTNRTFHHHTGLRRVAVGVFLTLVAIKVTNPIHGLYFETAPATAPFPHLAVAHQPLHWFVIGLSYALATVGYFMLFERLTQVSYETLPLGVLVGVTGLPLVLNFVGNRTPLLVDISHEPLGVAVFAVGIAFVFLERFQAIRLAGSDDKPVVVVNKHDHITEYNAAAERLFPALGDPGTVGEPLWSVVPAVAEAIDSESSVLSVERGGETRHFQLSESPFAAGKTPIGRLILFTDITARERDRRELERQNERLDQFASVVSHDLRNPLQVLRGALDGARATDDLTHLDRGEQAIERMEVLIDDVLSLARQGQPIDETESVSLTAVADSCWEVVDAADATFVVADDYQFRADPSRLRQLLENLYRNAIEHGGTDVTVTVGRLPDGDGFYVADDGPGIPPEARDEVFESGYSTADGGTGFGLAIVGEIVDAHGWEIAVTESEGGGARFEITGVEAAGRLTPSEAA